MLAIFILYTTSITLFTHVHVVNGVSIVHSHFYDFWDDNASEVGILKIMINFFSTSNIQGAHYSISASIANDEAVDSSLTNRNKSNLTGIPSENHQHTSEQLIMLEMLSHFRKAGLPLLLFFIVSIIMHAWTEIVYCMHCYVMRLFLGSYSLRGPPINLN